MSEVTAKDLREMLEKYFDYFDNTDWNPEPQKGLAAFDAMAEKAAHFDKLERLIEIEGSGFKKVFDQVLIHSTGTRSNKKLIGKGTTLIKAIEDVQE